MTAGRDAPTVALLDWYDANARELPWRIGPADVAAGIRPDPFRVWLSEIMLQQTTVATVRRRYPRFLERWPDVRSLAAAPLDDVLAEWAGLGYYGRARNLHACARMVVERHGGAFPDTEEVLLALPGVGDYTAAAIVAIAFDRPAHPVDGNIERVMARFFRINTPVPKLKVAAREAVGSIWPGRRSGDFAQALMDLGSGVCTPRKPACPGCPLTRSCAAFAAGDPERFPVRSPKPEKPTRFGSAYALFRRDGAILLERRPETGLLAGMLGLPGGDWRETKNVSAPPLAANAEWRPAENIRHTFSHFHLALEVFVAERPKGFRLSKKQQWLFPDEAATPTVMKKAIASALRLHVAQQRR